MELSAQPHLRPVRRLANFTFTDPWIKGDAHRTSFRTSLFLSREVPQVFQSQNNGDIVTVTDYQDNNSSRAYEINTNNNPAGRKFDDVGEASDLFPEYSWFDYQGDSVALQRVGGNIIFARPLNGGDPYKNAPWQILAGLNVQSVRPINFEGTSRVYGTPSEGDDEVFLMKILFVSRIIVLLKIILLD